GGAAVAHLVAAVAARARAARGSAEPLVAAGRQVRAGRRRASDLHHLCEYAVDRARMARARLRAGVDRPLVGARDRGADRALAAGEGVGRVRLRAAGRRARAASARDRGGGGLMRRLTRYIALEVLKGIGLALTVLVAVTSFVELV